MAGFLIWALVGVLFIGAGLYLLFSGKSTAIGFWANADVFPMEENDVKAYNKAVGKLWLVFGLVFLLLGLPLLAGHHSAWIVITIVGSLLEVIGVMAVYITVIERKYRKKK